MDTCFGNKKFDLHQNGFMLSEEEKIRFNRHIILDQIGMEGQEKLKAAKILVVGAGGLGCPVLQYLTAAGVGKIGIIDDDHVDLSNLQRQILFHSQDVGRLKAEVAAEKLRAQNPHTTFSVYPERLTSSNALSILEKYDLVIDGTDNFPTRYLINDACVLLNRPFIFGSIFKFEGQVAVFNYKNGPTYRCVFPTPPGAGEIPNCAQIGVIGVLPGLIGTIQANEAIKLIVEAGTLLSGKLLLLDALSMHQTILTLHRTDAADHIRKLTDYEDFCEPNPSAAITSIEVQELKSRLEKGESLTLLDVREHFERDICHIGGLHFPLGELADHIGKIPRDLPICVYCHHGTRSLRAAELLTKNYGFYQVLNVSGGIHAWSVYVDKKLPTY